MSMETERRSTIIHAYIIEVPDDRALKLVSNSLISAPIGASWSKQSRAHVKVIALREYPGVSIANSTVIQVQHVRAKVRVSALPRVRMFYLHADRQDPF